MRLRKRDNASTYAEVAHIPQGGQAERDELLARDERLLAEGVVVSQRDDVDVFKLAEVEGVGAGMHLADHAAPT